MPISRFFRPARLIFMLAAFAAVIGGFFLATTVFGGHSPSGAEYSRPKSSGPSTHFTMRPEDPGFVDFLTDFSDFPIYWVGDEINGLSLDYIARNVFSPEVGITTNTLTFFYGECVFREAPAEGGCSRPLTIVVEPYCLVPPEMIAPEAATAGMARVRDAADAMMAGGGLRIWTGSATIKIYASSLELIDDATAALVSVNGLGPSDTADALPAPDRDCSEYEMVPYPAQ